MGLPTKTRLLIASRIYLVVMILLSTTPAFAMELTKQQTRFKVAEQQYLFAKTNYDDSIISLKAQQERVKHEQQILKKKEQVLAKAKIDLNRKNAMLKVEENKLKMFRLKH